MHFSSAIVVAAAATAIAAPTNVWESPIEDAYTAPLEARATTCNPNTNLFRNPGFTNVLSPWVGTAQSGTSGGVQTQYYPVSWPAAGGPSAMAMNFTIPKGTSKSYFLEQPITLGAIRDGGSYTMNLNTWVSGTASASCSQIWYAGYVSIFPTGTTMPAPKGAPPGWFYQSNNVTVAANVGSDPTKNQKAGFQFTCAASGSEDAKVTIYVDNASIVDSCH